MRVLLQAAVGFRTINIVQHINHIRAADPLGILHARVLVRSVFVQLLYAPLRQVLHVVFAAEVQAAGGTGLDASRLKPRAHAGRTQLAFVDLLGLGVELGYVERAARNAVLAADAVFLIEVDDAVGVLHDGAIGRAGEQATRFGAVQASIL